MKTQTEITTQLCEGKSKLEEIDWNLAEKLVLERLSDELPSLKMWYEQENAGDRS